MSQQEKENNDKKLPGEELKNPETGSNGTSNNVDSAEEKIPEKTEENSFSGSAENSASFTSQEKDEDDHLEKAMLYESESTGQKAESELSEKEYANAHKDEVKGEKEMSAHEKESGEEPVKSEKEDSIESKDGAETGSQDDQKEENAPDKKEVVEEPLKADQEDKASDSKKIGEESLKAEQEDEIEDKEDGAETGSQDDQKEENAPDKKEVVEEPLKAEQEDKASDSKKIGEESLKAEQEDEIEDKEDGDVPVEPNRKSAHSEFEDSVAEDSEDETTTERHSIEKKDYHALSKEELITELERLVKKEKVQAIKEHVEEIRAEFNAKFDEELEEKKEDFLADGGNIIDFHYSTPLKKQFSSLYFDYKEKRNNYYKQLKQDLNQNLSRRLEIIEELKGLLDVEENINTTYKHFKDLQEKWRIAGPIPRDRYNTVWNTYHHHVENFYDFLHLNREFRDMDFKHNLEQKLKIIVRAEELVHEKDTNRALRELQMLHKMWKEEVGPVAKEYRDEIWDRFSEATKKIHDKRQAYYEELDEQFLKNLVIKQEIIEKIKNLADTPYTSHNQWQQKIKELEALRDQFFKAGKVPREKNEQTWSEFKQTVRQFNRNKNSYYKGLKKEQYENLDKKRELIQIAESNKDNEDFKATTPVMKKIQADWKRIGHVPRKDSDKVWKQFKAACNHYFNRMHAAGNEENAEEIKAFDQKKEILDNLKSVEFSGEKKTDLPKIKSAIEEWKNIGKVPYNKRFIEGKFNKLLDQLFSKLDVDRSRAEMMKYENKIQALNDADDDKKLRNEHYFLSKKVDETKAEIRQLENNLQFFANVDDDNPLVQEVHNNIRDHKEQLEVWKEKLEKIKSLY